MDDPISSLISKPANEAISEILEVLDELELFKEKVKLDLNFKGEIKAIRIPNTKKSIENLITNDFL